jgi:hypothetical protein
MSDIFFTEASEVPVPPAEVRIRALDARPRPDNIRVDVHLELTPFQQRPNIEVAINIASGRQVAALSVIEAIDPKMDFTMHIRQPEPGGSYTLAVHVFYSDVEATATSNGGQKSAGQILKKSRQVVDQRDLQFNTSSPK